MKKSKKIVRPEKSRTIFKFTKKGEASAPCSGATIDPTSTFPTVTTTGF